MAAWCIVLGLAVLLIGGVVDHMGARVLVQAIYMVAVPGAF